MQRGDLNDYIRNFYLQAGRTEGEHDIIRAHSKLTPGGASEAGREGCCIWLWDSVKDTAIPQEAVRKRNEEQFFHVAPPDLPLMPPIGGVNWKSSNKAGWEM